MSDIAIQITELSKRYRIGMREKYPTIRETLMQAVSTPLRKFRSWATGRNGEFSKDMIWALREVDLEVKQGEVVGIIGRNGAGKTTLLKILTGITEPTTGYADIYGRVGSLLEVGTGFHMELTGRENIFMNGAILGMRRHEVKRKFDEIVAFSEIEEFLDTPVKRYSSGMYMRLAFAVAAHLEPEILLIDEVLAVGDVAFQKKCLGKMGKVAKEGRTVFFVSHNMLAIQSLCTKAILIEDGRITYQGTTEKTVIQYLESVDETCRQPLAQRLDRDGGEEFLFAGVQFLNPRNFLPWSVLMSGQPVIIRISYLSRVSHIIEDVGISITFFTITGSHLFGCKSRAVGMSLDVHPGEGYTDCILPKWPVKAGRYTFDLLAERAGIDLDWVPNAGAIDVEASDYYGSGFIPSADKPGVLVDYAWPANREVDIS